MFFSAMAHRGNDVQHLQSSWFPESPSSKNLPGKCQIPSSLIILGILTVSVWLLIVYKGSNDLSISSLIWANF